MSNLPYAYNWFLRQGYQPHQAAGILGNLVQESGRGLNTRAVHDAGTGYGIAGWRDPQPGTGRRTALFNFAASRGADPAELDTQLAFLDHELRTSEASVGQQLRSAPDAQSAARAFISFERPQGWTRANPEGGHGWENRRNNAAAILAGGGDLVAAPAGGPVRRVATTTVAPGSAPAQQMTGSAPVLPAAFGDLLAQQQTAAVTQAALAGQQQQIGQREQEAQARRRALFGGGMAALYG